MIEMTAPQSPPAVTNRSSPNTSRTRRIHRPPVAFALLPGRMGVENP